VWGLCRIKIYKKNSFYSIVRSSESLGLIHSGIDDLKFMQTRSKKKYYITFIYDYKGIVILFLKLKMIRK
jgi:hypothetical protein